MFSIGTFSRLAQLSIRVLRHYDEIGLLVPAHINRSNGYRFYTASQLADVNRIVALKDLGLTLEQVREVMDDKLSTDAVAGMLRLEKLRAEKERAAAEKRLVDLDRRLAELSDDGRLSAVDIVEKAIPASPFLAFRTRVRNLDAASGLMETIEAAAGAIASSKPLIAVSYDPFFDTEDLDIEMGYPVGDPRALDLGGERRMRVRELEAVERMLSVMYVGGLEEGHRRSHHVIALWLERHGCQLGGPGRELVHASGDQVSPTIEIQYPVASSAAPPGGSVPPRPGARAPRRP